jgi:thiol-disulfide isomerase/thioredoxin
MVQLLLRAASGPVIAGLLALAVVTPSVAAADVEVAVGGVLRDAVLQGLNGPSQRLSAFRGKPLLINVWASWCGPCRAEMASLERLAWGRGSREFAIIGISTDDYADKATLLLQGTHATISQFLDTQLQMENMLGASRLPLTVLVDAEGRVLKKVTGAREWDSPESLRLIDDAFRWQPR